MRWVLELLADVSHCWYFSVPSRGSVSFSRCCFTTSVNIKRLSRATKRCLSQFVKANNCECGPLSLSLFIEGMLRLLIWINSKCNKCLNCQKSKNSFRLYSYCLCLSLSFCLIVTLIYTELKEFKAFVLLKPSWEILTGGIHWIQTRPMCSTLPASRWTMYVFILQCNLQNLLSAVQCSVTLPVWFQA